jgi:hypothetical protein
MSIVPSDTNNMNNYVVNNDIYYYIKHSILNLDILDELLSSEIKVNNDNNFKINNEENQHIEVNKSNSISNTINKSDYVLINYSTKNNDYKILKYSKDSIKIHPELSFTLGFFRSVIFNKSNKMLCFSPPKSIPVDLFMKKYPEKSSNIIVQEFVEGTMINVFWDPAISIIGGWVIATKNTIDGNNSFIVNGKKFSEMFLEATVYNNFNLNMLNNNYCYSFVLQHPENRIVSPFTHPQLYLINIFEIKYEEREIIVNEFSYDSINSHGLWNTTIKFPKLYSEFTSYEEAIEALASRNTPYNIQGVVFKNIDTCERCKFRNPIYEEIKHLKGNQSKIQFQYLSLRKEQKVGEFLKYFPEHIKDFDLFRKDIHNFTNTLFQNYISCYIKKQKPLIEFPNQYRAHMIEIHKIYMNQLREKRQHVTNTVVINYVNELPVPRQMFSLNYHLRKRNIDFEKDKNQHLTNS